MALAAVVLIGFLPLLKGHSVRAAAIDRNIFAFALHGAFDPRNGIRVETVLAIRSAVTPSHGDFHGPLHRDFLQVEVIDKSAFRTWGYLVSAAVPIPVLIRICPPNVYRAKHIARLALVVGTRYLDSDGFLGICLLQPGQQAKGDCRKKGDYAIASANN